MTDQRDPDWSNGGNAARGPSAASPVWPLLLSEPIRYAIAGSSKTIGRLTWAPQDQQLCHAESSDEKLAYALCSGEASSCTRARNSRGLTPFTPLNCREK